MWLNGPADAQAVGALSSRGPLINPLAGTVLAEVTRIPAGPHTFRIVASAAGASPTALVIEWRDADERNPRPRWAQGLMIPANGTVTVPIDEAHEFGEGDSLRLLVYSNAAGTVWGSISVK
jgi:hypothetical protein